MPERRNVEYPSTARFTIGSPARLKRRVEQHRDAGARAVGLEQRVEARRHRRARRVCTRAVPSTWVTAASRSRHSARTGNTPDMKRPSARAAGRQLEVALRDLDRHRRRERPELLAVLDLLVEPVAHLAARAARRGCCDCPSARGPSSPAPCIQPTICARGAARRPPARAASASSRTSLEREPVLAGHRASSSASTAGPQYG